jgi:hypothetical protein
MKKWERPGPVLKLHVELLKKKLPGNQVILTKSLTLWTPAGGEDPESIRRFARRAGAQIQVQPGDYQIDHALIAVRIDGNRIVDRVYGLTAIEQLLRNMPTSTTR